MTDVLPSWRDGATRRKIIDFVAAVTSGAGAVPENERIAVFDNDGTLWSEKPMISQLHFVVEHWAAAATADPTLADRQPYQAAVTGDFSWLAEAIDKHYAGDDADLQVLIGALVGATAHQSVEEYADAVTTFYRDARHPVLGVPYADTVYQPMVELLGYLEANGFSCYIVSAGERDFMRPMTTDNYGVPPERVIGSAFGLEYDPETNEVSYGETLQFFDDGPEKPVRIWSRIGRRPILAAGNANGDIPMLRYAQGHPHSLSLLVHHDDDTGRGDAPYDDGAETALAAAHDQDFTVVSIKDDWGLVFPPGSTRP